MATKQRAAQGGRLEPAPGLPLWREAFVLRDWLSLRTSLVYNGFGVPHGDGSPVVVIPGFLGSDRYLMELHYWLKRIGYRPYYSRIGRNADCPDVLMRRLLQTVNRARAENRCKVRLIGHSLGGTIARTLAARKPGAVAQVITLASPIRAAQVHPAVLRAADAVRGRVQNAGAQPESCYTVGCTCAFVTSVGETPPPSVIRTAIYTKSDGVVDWRCCLDEDEHLNIEVKGTHAGLAFNPSVYRVVARLLAEVKAK